MDLRLTFQDKVLRLSIRAGKMVLEVTIPPLSPHLNPLIPYFLTLALLFSFISIPPLQKYAILPVFLFFLTLFVALYYALDYRYLIGSGLLFLLACPLFLIAGQEQVAESLANYTYGFLVFGLLFIAINSLAEKVRKRGYLFRMKREKMYGLWIRAEVMIW